MYSKWRPASCPRLPTRAKPEPPRFTVAEENTHPRVLHPVPVTFYGWPTARDRDVTDGGRPGNGPGGRKCRGRSPGHRPPWARPDQEANAGGLGWTSEPPPLAERGKPSQAQPPLWPTQAALPPPAGHSGHCRDRSEAAPGTLLPPQAPCEGLGGPWLEAFPACPV